MAFDINKFAQAAEEYTPAPPPPKEKTVWENISDTASDVADWAGNAWDSISDTAGNLVDWAGNTISDTVQATEDFLLARNYDELQKGKEEMQYFPFRETAREFTAAYADNPDSMLQPLAQTIRSSETAYNYWQTDEDKLKRAREISAETSVPAEAILYDAEAWKSANIVCDDIQAAKKLNMDNNIAWSLDDVYNKYPEIKGIADKDPVSGALVLKDVANVGKELDIIDTFTKYLSIGNSQLELNNLRFKAGMGTADENDLQRMQDLERKLEEDNKNNQIRFLDNPLAYAVSGVASSAPEMWQSVYTGLEDAAAWWAAGAWAGAAAGSVLPGAGTAAGAAAGGVIAGTLGAVKSGVKALASRETRKAVIREYMMRQAAKATAPRLAKFGGQAGAFAGMATPEAGERYAEYMELKDKDGNPLMSKEDAWHRALLGGSVNAALETAPTFGVLGNMLKGTPHAAKVMGSIIESGTAKVNAGNVAGKVASKYAANTLKIAGVEAGEEGTQAIADDILTNDIKHTYGRAYTGKDGKLYYTGDALSAYDIFKDGLQASVQALPSSLIFGAAGGITPGIGMAGRYAARARQLSRIENEYGALARQTYTGTVMAEQLQQAVRNSRLKETAPDIQRKIIRAKAAGTGFETMYIDTELVLEKENGREDLEALAKSVGLSQEELQTAIDTKGTIAVPLECYAQSESSSEVLEAASFDAAAEPMARMQKNAQDVIRRMQELVEKSADHQIKMVDIISKELFPEETQEAAANRELVQAAIITNPENPVAGLRELTEKYKAKKMAMLEPALKFLDDTSGQGTVIVPIDDEGHTVRLSENAKWYQDFWKEHGRKPNKGELMDIAEEMVTGKSNIETWAITSEEEELQAKDSLLEMAELNHKIGLLEGIKPKMRNINGIEMNLTEGFSAEAYKVYRFLTEKLKKAPGTAGRAGRINAVLFARHADIFAQAMRENGAKDYTALDYLRQHHVVFNQDLNGGMNQNNYGTKRLSIPAEKLQHTDRPLQKALEEFSRLYPNGTVAHTALGNVRISRRDVKNSLSHGLSPKKAAVIETLKDGIEQAEHVRTIPDYDNKQKTNHFFVYTVNIGNDENFVLCRVVEQNGQKRLYVHEVANREEIKEKSNSLLTQAVTTKGNPVLRGAALYASILSEYVEKVDSQTEIFNQTAWHGSPYDFDKFDLGRIGDGSGLAMHGWGIYFAANKKMVDKYKKLSSTKGLTYKTDIPTAKEMLHENKSLHEQPSSVKKAIEAIYDNFSDTQKKQFRDTLLSYKKNGSKNKKHIELKTKVKSIENVKEALQKIADGKIATSFGKRSIIRLLTRNGFEENEIEKFFSDNAQAISALKKYNDSKKDEIQKLSDEIDKINNDEQQVHNDDVNNLEKEIHGKTVNLHTLATGKEIYDAVVKIFGNDSKAASMKFNENGVKGVDYVSGDGHCFVVFDDKAVSIIEKYNQSVNGNAPLGQSAPLSDGSYIISLLSKADESTFLHECGHIFLWDLEQMAGFGGRYAKEWETVRSWAEYKTGDEKLYKGVPFEDEFTKLAGNIRAAEDAGDVNEADKMKRQWMHERFARGFEMYLKQGKAPSKGLQAVFRTFKQFLKKIYVAFTGEGVRASQPVERIMARMIASDDEIEAAELDDRFKDISKAGGKKLMNESTQDTYQRWREEAKADAKEKLMKILMADLEEEKTRRYNEAIADERVRMRKELEQMPLYLGQRIIEETGSKNAVVEMGFYDSVEAYEQELKDVPSLEQALDDYMAEFAKEKDREIIQAQVSEEKIAELIQQTHYHKKLMALETEIMRAKEESVNKINAKAKAAMEELDASIQSLHDDIDIQLERKTDQSVKKVIGAINKLRFSTRWTPSELARIDDIIHSATKQEMSQALKEFTKQAGEWKKNIKIVQEAFDGRMKMMKKMAEQDLAGRSIAEACSYNTYVTREKKAANLVDKMIRIGKWDVAMVQQEARFTSAALADVAKKNQEHVNKLLHTVEKQLKARSVKLPKEERYWHRQLAYLLHLIPEAPEKPEDCPKLEDIFKGLNESLDVDFDIGGIYDIVTQENFTGYRSLTMAQLEDAVNLMTVLYKTGRDKFKMKSFDGMLISDVVDEILDDIQANSQGLPSVETKAVMDDKGGIGYNDLLAKIPRLGETISQLGQQYEISILRPENLLRLLGKSAHKYIMGLYDKAAVDEGRRMAEAIAELSSIMSVYTQKEKKEMKKQRYEFMTGYGVEKITKENILCMALNYGNETNWLRLCRGFEIEDGEQLRAFIDENMSKRDWLTVQAIWDHIGKYWKDTVKVEQELNGVTLKGVEARGFTVKVDGDILELRGGYYPIVYNPEKSTRAADQSVDEAARKTMSGAQVLGTGRGFVNARSEAKNISRPLLLQLNVASEHVQAVIHNISYRIACRDVYRLTHDGRFQEAVINTLGRKALDSIQKWGIDCWRVLPNDKGIAEGFFNKILAGLRHNAGFAIMGFRAWPAIENITNIFPMMDRIGAINSLMAISDFYSDKKKNKENLNLSPFMKERENSIDRDLRSVQAPFEGSGPVSGRLKQWAYLPLVWTDRLLSEPLWCRVYKTSIEKNFVAVHQENQKQISRFKAAQMKAQELRGQMADLVMERSKLRNSLKEDDDANVPYTPAALNHITAAKVRIAEIEKILEPMNKELWEAERDIDLLENISIKTPDDILEEAKELSVRDADAAVRDTFGSGQNKDLAPVLREKSELMKMATVFMSYFNVQMNAIIMSYYGGKFAREDLTGPQNLSRWMPLARTLMYRLFLTAILGTLLKMAITHDGDDDKHKYRKVKDAEGEEHTEEIPGMERFLVQFGKNFVSTATGSLIGVREIVSVLNNLAFEGTDYGRGVGGNVIATAFADKAVKALKLAAEKGDKDAEIDEKERKAKEKYAKMTPAARRKFDEEQKYKKPPKRITYADIIKELGGSVVAATAARTGITDTMANAAFTTLQYIMDGDGRYDKGWGDIENIVWSAIFNKKPVEREVPKKPEEPKKKKKGAKK